MLKKFLHSPKEEKILNKTKLPPPSPSKVKWSTPKANGYCRWTFEICHGIIIAVRRSRIIKNVLFQPRFITTCYFMNGWPLARKTKRPSAIIWICQAMKANAVCSNTKAFLVTDQEGQPMSVCFCDSLKSCIFWVFSVLSVAGNIRKIIESKLFRVPLLSNCFTRHLPRTFSYANSHPRDKSWR